MLAQLYAEAFGRHLLYLHGLKTRAKLYALWETYLITYTNTDAFILNHNTHITITYLRIFRNSYNIFTYIVFLVTSLCLYIKYYTYGRRILILISRRMHTYIDFLICDTELIHILILISRLTYTYTYLPYDIYLYVSPVGHILILIPIPHIQY